MAGSLLTGFALSFGGGSMPSVVRPQHDLVDYAEGHVGKETVAVLILVTLHTSEI